MINTQYEIGHWEACTSLTGKHTLNNGSFKDTYFSQCHGPYEKASDKGNPNEPDDSPCYLKKDTHGGHAAPNLVTGCDVFFNAIGDLDYDGQPYYADWPLLPVLHPGQGPRQLRVGVRQHAERQQVRW